MKLRTMPAAGTLPVVLPVVAVAGCGAEKKRTTKAELTAAAEHLQDSQALANVSSFDLGELFDSFLSTGEQDL